MTDQVMSELEKRIRQNAVRDARSNLFKSLNLAATSIKALNTNATYPYTLSAGLLNTAAEELIENNAVQIGNYAVHQFHESYSKLIQEYPELIAQAQEEAVQEYIDNG
ncbi:hypothetical protein STASHLEY_00880 [Brevundimonas phage vB_BpoS-StAshley]|nr:hypothetical protein STASHLEY_00880 [Brevundimonas phage vB_BpoS-StAshley]